MALLGENTHVFIVRIWHEPREIEGAAPEWRGVIEHVPTGKRRYVDDLDDVCAFISEYVPHRVVKPGLGGRIREWLTKLNLGTLTNRT